jgi:hypothetical protein
MRTTWTLKRLDVPQRTNLLRLPLAGGSLREA